MPLVSIIIPHFNRAELLAETLASVREQSLPDWEVIVVDDGSDDREWQDIQPLADERTRLMRRRDGRKGPSRCRNLGAAEARGEFLLFLDSDDLLAPWCLSDRLEEAETSPERDFWVFPVMLFENHPGDLSVCWNRLEGERDLERFLRSDPPWHTSSPLWRKEAFERIGGFNEAVMYGDDADLHVRALLDGSRYVKFPQALPDVFVRRGMTTRITNSLSPNLVQSRLVRLLEGSRALRKAEGEGEARDIWEGQYFVEGEFILFNLDHPGPWVRNVLKAWEEECHPPATRKLIVTFYFQLALAARERFYLLLRLARRLAMLLLPGNFFPKGGYFQSYQVPPEVQDDLRGRLGVKLVSLEQRKEAF